MPTATSQQTPSQPPQQGGVSPLLVASIATVLAGALLPTLAFAPLSAILVGRGRGRPTKASLERDRAALKLALEVLEEFPMPPTEGLGPASRYVQRMNELRRAAFLVNAMARIRTAAEAASAQGISRTVALDKARDAERGYFRSHIKATQYRAIAASRIDGLADRYGDELGWYSKMDRKTTTECRDAHGKNFSASIPPAIGWPGVVHAECRCQPGKPHPQARRLR
jgi:hypothetical protein